MADEGTGKRPPSIPNWQYPSQNSSASQPTTTASDTNNTAPSQELDPLEHARRFLDDDSIKNASRERKVEFLETKGLKPEQIEDLLSTQQEPDDAKADGDLKTVHDSTTTVEPKQSQPEAKQAPLLNEAPSEARVAPRSDVPPIITYPEFLLKPQKPPPLVTFERLANAAYVLAGLSALTYGASKYLVQPMLESLTDSRHDLAITAQDSLSKLNNKLETTVSHVPYIPPLHSKHQLSQDEDVESIDSDPTELFHRDIATQTTPPRSRSSSLSSSSPNQTTIETQSSHLTALHSSLRSLLSSTTTHFAENDLQSSLTDLQSTIDKVNTSSNDYDTTYSSYYTSSSSKTNKGTDQDSQAAKFKQDIRALKGAFLSSRNFPTARPAAPFTIPQPQR